MLHSKLDISRDRLYNKKAHLKPVDQCLKGQTKLSQRPEKPTHSDVFYSGGHLCHYEGTNKAINSDGVGQNLVV